MMQNFNEFDKDFNEAVREITKVKYPLKDGIGSVELINSMGNDLSIVNDARVSYNKQSYEITEREIKLINYLIKHKHKSPFRGVVFKFRVKAPLSTTRQWYKHSVASSYVSSQYQGNETSFRYTQQDNTEFYIPDYFRTQSKTNKQDSDGRLSFNDNSEAKNIYIESLNQSMNAYRKLINIGVAREQARDVLPPCIYTSFIWTVSLDALINFLTLRLGEGAQLEIHAYAEAVKQLVEPIVPITMEAMNI